MNTNSASAEANQTFSELIEVFSSIETEKINTIPFESSWTAGQLAQHIILSAGGFVQLLNGPVTDTHRDPEANIPTLKRIFLDFSTKMKSPDFTIPEAKDYNKQKLIATLEQIKADLIQSIENLDTTKTCTSFELPGSGHITRAEAITFSIVHTQRHVHQLKAIRQKLSE